MVAAVLDTRVSNNITVLLLTLFLHIFNITDSDLGTAASYTD
jgi:hypothetical protein